MEKLESMEPTLEEKTEGCIQKQRKKHDAKKVEGRTAKQWMEMYYIAQHAQSQNGEKVYYKLFFLLNYFII
jgi:hypothetical protein